ncbi:hypothetical protein [Acidihalobacter ferrooxydans]|uniref:Yip1 domain-containing protein n=1 Tax=Acidihalobacter ferrooxydans TaxID=1765967 RepID=A0A1P8UG42_9GAMM|nr:hypothetical protein [Acidihalobacter ferrooxydans]APZ42799.1 hypothetical protein BW247_06590 [Acidihalobacter ferrooxydans]
MPFLSVLKVVLRLCLLRDGPQDLPASAGLLATSLGGYSVVGTVNVLPIYGLGGALAQALIETVILGAWTYGALMLAHHPRRLVQTLTAIGLAGTVLGILLTPQLYVLFRAEANQVPATFTSITYLLTVGWLLAVFGRIFQQALDLRQAWLGVLIAIGLVLTSSLLIIGIFGNATAG